MDHRGRRSDELVYDDLTGPATHLASLIPTLNPYPRASPWTVYDYLRRAELEIEVIAIAAIIVKETSESFRDDWWVYRCRSNEQSPVRTEIIALCALAVAVAVCHDGHRLGSYWVNCIGHGDVKTDDVNACVRRILKKLDYNLLPLCHPHLVEEMIEDFEETTAHLKRCRQQRHHQQFEE
ncbi:MAG: hypothetical protein M1827_001833 [Pycnora praestabilis]|nr:MAG: hypothetical protein M1827_001833 [Pycnora praestabilis]